MPSRAALVALLAIALAAPAARATDFSVSTGPQLANALSTAQNNGTADRILLAAGTYAGPFSYGSNEDLEVLGAGEGKTTITQSAGQFALLLGGTSATYHVADLSFAVSGASPGGLRIQGPGQVERVGATLASGVNGAGIMILHSGVTVDHVTVAANSSGTGVEQQAAGSSVLTDSAITGASTGVLADIAGATLNAARVHVTGPTDVAFGAEFGATITVSDSLVGLGTTSGVGLDAGDVNNGPASFSSHIIASRLTIVGDGVANQRGVSVAPNTAGDNFTVGLHDSVLVGLKGGSLTCSGVTGTGAITTDWSSVPAPTSSNCTPGITQNHPVTTTGLNFLDAAHGDYRLRFDSPLVDGGDPGILGPSTDLAGLARPIDGDGDGTARRDVGAYEYQRRAPIVTASAAPAGVATGEAATFTATASDPDPGETPTLTWAFDDGATGSGLSVSHAFATPGTHTATVTATDPAGVTATAQASVTVAAPGVPSAPGGDPGTPGGGTPADTVAPVLGRVSLRSARARFTLSEGATVTVTLARRVGGHWRRVRPTIRLTGAAGSNVRRVKASRWRALRPGRWRATFVARDAAGNRSALVRVRFRIPRAA